MADKTPDPMSLAAMWACIAALALAWAGVVWVAMRAATFDSLQ